MKVISLHQPYASLIFLDREDRKYHETRGWKPPSALIGQRIGIHASKKFHRPPGVPMELVHALHVDGQYVEPPRGAFLGTVRLAEVYQADDARREAANPFDLLAGHWDDGRWLWRLEDPQPLKKPVPMIGRQGWWEIRYG